MANVFKKATLIAQLQKKIDALEEKRKTQWEEKFPEFQEKVRQYAISWQELITRVKNWQEFREKDNIPYPQEPYFDHRHYRETIVKYKNQLAILQALDGDEISMEEFVVKKKFSLQDFFGTEDLR